MVVEVDGTHTRLSLTEIVGLYLAVLTAPVAIHRISIVTGFSTSDGVISTYRLHTRVIERVVPEKASTTAHILRDAGILDT